MSTDYSMKLVRFSKNEGMKILCKVNNYNKIKAIIDDLEETYDYPDDLKEQMDEKNYFYKVFTIEDIRNYITKRQKDIENCKKKIEEVKDNLKAYYQGGNYNEDIEYSLKEELATYEECLNPDSDYDNDTNCLNTAKTIENDIIFVNDYLVPLHWEDKEEGLYLLLEGSC